jgi:hypothetical protein
MAKKYKRSVSVQTRTTPNSETPAPSEQKPTSMFARRTAPNEFVPDYTYIRNDLKRIGILSGSFVVILVALSFILPLLQR